MAVRTPQHGLTRTAKGWVKKIHGVTRWVCSLSVAPTAEQADAVFEQRSTELYSTAPSPVAPAADTVTVAALVNLFLDRKRRAGIDRRTFSDYEDAVNSFADVAGEDRAAASMTPADFAKVRAGWDIRFGPDRLAKFVLSVRSMFKWARKPPLRLPEPDYGDEFQVPSKRAFRKARKGAREEHGAKLFTPEEVRTLLAAVAEDRTALALVLLALNGGFGNTDLAELPRSALDLEGGWIDYARGKTGIDRRVPLWPETVAALSLVLAYRPASRVRPAAWTNPRLVFLTRHGRPLVEDREGTKSGRPQHKDRIGTRFNVLCAACGLTRRGRGFYSLRRTFRTLADETGDQRAAAIVMGHEVADVSSLYVQAVSDERLVSLVNHVRSRLGLASASTERGSRGSRAASASKRGAGAVPAKPSRRARPRPG